MFPKLIIGLFFIIFLLTCICCSSSLDVNEAGLKNNYVGSIGVTKKLSILVYIDADNDLDDIYDGGSSVLMAESICRGDNWFNKT